MSKPTDVQALIHHNAEMLQSKRAYLKAWSKRVRARLDELDAALAADKKEPGSALLLGHFGSVHNEMADVVRALTEISWLERFNEELMALK